MGWVQGRVTWSSSFFFFIFAVGVYFVESHFLLLRIRKYCKVVSGLGRTFYLRVYINTTPIHPIIRRPRQERAMKQTPRSCCKM
ncbi:hypothetical protein ASPFODRAFT_679131 [Aspergillus luchuensis CBS 106.47]|uniref:Uncharacterized protein n=1 Tax=Aspergillus luchuensis (strain CBS 106.47) TaxID=1137211 RepID=A0A1M3TCD0_ASPLC|nr:hypothetical protein ASPFODRAFT_679131 [Aspergillus luchuensis CBS 106.47]